MRRARLDAGVARAAGRLACAVLLALSCAFGCMLVSGGAFPAFADEQSGEKEDDVSKLDNTVNPFQLPDSSFIFDTSIEDLFTADAYFDGQTVQVVGEAVGDVVIAETDADYRWITLQSLDSKSNASVAVYMTDTQAARIDTLGRYGTTGTTLQIVGTYHLSCPEHTGVSDLHATSVSIAQTGSAAPDAFNPEKFVPGAVLVLVGFVLMGVFYYLRERRR